MIDNPGMSNKRSQRRRSAKVTGPGWLADRRVRTKLAAVLVIPTVAFLALAGVNVTASVRSADAFNDNGKVAELARQVTELVHEIQQERDLTAGQLVAGARRAPGVKDQRAAVDRLTAAYRAAAAPLRDELGDERRSRFDAVEARLAALPTLRQAVDDRAHPDQAVFSEYGTTIRALLDLAFDVNQLGGDGDYTRQATAFTNLSQLKEISSQVRGTTYSLAHQGGFAFGQFQDYADLLARQRAALDTFLAQADDEQRSLYAATVNGQAVLAVARIRQAAVNRQASADLELDPQQWLSASATELELLRSVEQGLLEGVVVRSAALTEQARRDASATALLIALTLAIALLASFWVADSMARPLRYLRTAAQDIADRRLPEAVRRLRMTTTGELDTVVHSVGIQAADEIGDVAQAFDAVHQQAVRLAAEQAALRSNVSDMFLNLARRNQTLIDRLLGRISELEQEETDPVELENLYVLDHLATRMRRNAENLVVLSGAEPSVRRWGAPVPLADVVEAAVAEIEDYTRVELGVIDEVPVQGRAASDLAHLLAELVENATMFSPPGAPVTITGAEISSGFVLEIEDRGLGMSDQELLAANHRLAEPPLLDFSIRQRLGLFVVAQLARRYGIKVQLRHSAYGGLAALVGLPASLLADPNADFALDELEAAAAPLPVGVGIVGGGRAPVPTRVQTLRSDWFSNDMNSVYLPLRPHGIQRAPRIPGERQMGSRPEPPPSRNPLLRPHAGQAIGPPMPPPAPPPPVASNGNGNGGLAAGPGGLPKRVPKERLAPGLSQPAPPAPAPPPPAPAAGSGSGSAGGRRRPRRRSPEARRSALSNYQAGLSRGRAVTGQDTTGDVPMPPSSPPPGVRPPSGSPRDLED